MPARDAFSETADPDPAPDQAASGVGRPGARRSLALVAVAATLVVGMIVVVALSRPTPTVTDPDAVTADTPPLLTQDAAADEQLPAVTLPPLGDLGPPDGIDMAVPPGEPVVVNFWATWCAPCVEEMPMLQRVADDLDIRTVGVDYLDLQPDKAVALADELGISYPLVRDDDGAFGQAIGLIGTPTTLLVDPDGVVRRRLTGALTEEQLRTAITEDLGGG